MATQQRDLIERKHYCCAWCGLKWNVANNIAVDEKDYLCPSCRTFLRNNHEVAQARGWKW